MQTTTQTTNGGARERAIEYMLRFVAAHPPATAQRGKTGEAPVVVRIYYTSPNGNGYGYVGCNTLSEVRAVLGY